MESSSSRSRASRVVWANAYEAFRERLIFARTTARLTQREAAALLGRSQAFVGKSETGERRVDVVELAEFARIYRRPLRYFLPDTRAR